MSSDATPANQPTSANRPEAHGTFGGNHTDSVRTEKRHDRIHFWGTFAALCLLAFIAGLDVTVITTALPQIIDSVGGASQYVWIANSFVVASAVLQPLMGSLANIFGRRMPLIASTVLFALGSGIAGGARTAGELIGGRVVQGIGSGGINVLLDIVCCDLVPLRERGKYLGLMFSWSGLAAALGPPVGGALAQSNWRWIFWMNLPICGLALAALLMFMRVKTGQSIPGPEADRPKPENSLRTVLQKLKHLDYTGNAIFALSMISLLFGLVQGGALYPWSSWRVILPITLGVAGWIAFHVQQKFSAHPIIPTYLFGNRTSAIAYLLTFLSSILVQVLAYFLPIYFQAVNSTTTLDSGVDFLPMAIGSLGFAVIAGIILSYLGRYRPLHAVSFALSALAFGLLTRLDAGTPKAAWVWYELIASMGSGLIQAILLPAIMAPLSESDVAVSSATYSFIRSFGWIWGVTAPSLIFNAVFDQNLFKISNPELRAQLFGGRAYSFASQIHRLRSVYDVGTMDEVVGVYTESLRAIWWFGLAISLISLLLVGGEKEIELRKELETDYGLDEKNSNLQASGAHNGE